MKKRTGFLCITILLFFISSIVDAGFEENTLTLESDVRSSLFDTTMPQLTTPSTHNTDDTPLCMVMETAYSHLLPSPPSPKPLGTSTAEEYCWTNVMGEDWTTPARSQGPCGSCWVFAALGIFESVIKIKEQCPSLEPDLSEQYVLSCLPLAGSCHGGWPYNALKYMKDTSPDGNNCNGALLEHCFPYQADDTLPCSGKDPRWQQYLVPIANCGYWVPDGSLEDRDSIKTQIMETGPITAGILATEDFISWGYTHHAATDYFPHSDPSGGINHIVIIMGWKDNESIPHGGYWICKNSWGPNWGYNGLFNLEYGGLNIESNFSTIVWVDYDPESYDWYPVAHAGGPYCGYLDETVSFDAQSSFDADGNIVSCLWDFGDGSTGIGETSTHAYQITGIYTITLTIIDAHNQVAQDHTTVCIQRTNTAPQNPVFMGANQGRKGYTYDFSCTTHDADDNTVWYYIDWGDTETEQWLGPYSSGDTLHLSHCWEQLGYYTIRVKAKDIYGAESGEQAHTITIKKEKSRTAFFPEILNNMFPLLNLLKHLAFQSH
jgi:hypothetical protein